jgi:ketosteroid isomerase-like protein
MLCASRSPRTPSGSPQTSCRSGGKYVIVKGRQRAENDRGSFDAPFIHVLEYRDGKAVRGEFFTDSAKAAKLIA